MPVPPPAGGTTTGDVTTGATKLTPYLEAITLALQQAASPVVVLPANNNPMALLSSVKSGSRYLPHVILPLL